MNNDSNDIGIRLDAAAIQPLVEKAILDSLTPEKRDELISQAIKSLLTVQSTTAFGTRNQSPLQAAFDNAVQGAASRAVQVLLNDSESALGAQVQQQVGVVLTEMSKNNYDGLPEAIGKGIATAVTAWLQDRR